MGRILVIRGGAVGDFILTLPVIELLRKGLPENHIEILGYRPMIDLALASGHADAVQSIDYGPMSGFFAPDSVLDPRLCDYFKSFNVVISYLYDPDGFFHGNLERAEVKTILRGIHKPVSGGGHASRQLAIPLEQLALFLENPAPVIRVTDPVPDETLALPRQVAIHPGSGSVAKNWSLEAWAMAGLEIYKKAGDVELLLVTGEAEVGRADVIESVWRGGDVPYRRADQLPLTELAGELRRCALFLGHDSGVSHLAAASECPCVLLFGPTDHETWAPQNEKVRLIRAPGGKLEEIALGEVVDAAVDVLRAG